MKIKFISKHQNIYFRHKHTLISNKKVKHNKRLTMSANISSINHGIMKSNKDFEKSKSKMQVRIFAYA